jgi:hypothetical protein
LACEQNQEQTCEKQGFVQASFAMHDGFGGYERFATFRTVGLFGGNAGELVIAFTTMRLIACAFTLD